MNKNIILDRLKLMTQIPNPTLFYVWITADGPIIKTQPWGAAKHLTWSQAATYLGMSPAKKPMGRAGESRVAIRRRHG